MKKFLVLYRSSQGAQQQMASMTPEQAKAGMEMWMGWAKKAGSAVVDLGAPVAGPSNDKKVVAGFSIFQAASSSALEELLRDHPHRHAPDGSIEVYEFQSMPGM